METMRLLTEVNSDANEKLAERIRIVCKEVDGGLSGFFQRLNKDNAEVESDVLDSNFFKRIVKNHHNGPVMTFR